jgi:group I intron endonuclease
MGYVYKITNTITNKCYIGVTVQPDCNRRWRKHINSLKYKEGCPLLKKSMQKHGVENFKFEILIICFDDDVVKFEKEYIKKFNSQTPNGYNILSGGQIGDGHVGFKHRPETIEKVKESLRKFKEANPNHYETYRERHQATMKTINLSECIKNSDKFQKAMAERRANNIKRGKGAIISEETKQKISEGLKKYYMNNQHPSTTNTTKEAIKKALSKPIAQYTKEGVLVREYKSITEADEMSGVKRSNIQQTLYGNTKTAGGFVWKFIPKTVE